MKSSYIFLIVALLHIAAIQTSMNTLSKPKVIACSSEECIAHYNKEYDKIRQAIDFHCIGETGDKRKRVSINKIEGFKPEEIFHCNRMVEALEEVAHKLEISNRKRYDDILVGKQYEPFAGARIISPNFHDLLIAWKNEKARDHQNSPVGVIKN